MKLFPPKILPDLKEHDAYKGSGKVSVLMIIGFMLIMGIFVVKDYLDTREFIRFGKVVRANITNIKPGGKTGLQISYYYTFSNIQYVGHSSLSKSRKSIY